MSDNPGKIPCLHGDNCYYATCPNYHPIPDEVLEAMKEGHDWSKPKLVMINGVWYIIFKQKPSSYHKATNNGSKTFYVQKVGSGGVFQVCFSPELTPIEKTQQFVNRYAGIQKFGYNHEGKPVITGRICLLLPENFKYFLGVTKLPSWILSGTQTQTMTSNDGTAYVFTPGHEGDYISEEVPNCKFVGCIYKLIDPSVVRGVYVIMKKPEDLKY